MFRIKDLQNLMHLRAWGLLAPASISGLNNPNVFVSFHNERNQNILITIIANSPDMIYDSSILTVSLNYYKKQKNSDTVNNFVVI